MGLAATLLLPEDQRGTAMTMMVSAFMGGNAIEHLGGALRDRVSGANRGGGGDIPRDSMVQE